MRSAIASDPCGLPFVPAQPNDYCILRNMASRWSVFIPDRASVIIDPFRRAIQRGGRDDVTSIPPQTGVIHEALLCPRRVLPRGAYRVAGIGTALRTRSRRSARAQDR